MITYVAQAVVTVLAALGVTGLDAEAVQSAIVAAWALVVAVLAVQKHRTIRNADAQATRIALTRTLGHDPGPVAPITKGTRPKPYKAAQPLDPTGGTPA